MWPGLGGTAEEALAWDEGFLPYGTSKEFGVGGYVGKFWGLNAEILYYYTVVTRERRASGKQARQLDGCNIRIAVAMIQAFGLLCAELQQRDDIPYRWSM